MELSRKSWLYKLMDLYCDPAEDICGFTRQLIPLFIMFFVFLLGTVGFTASILLGLYDIPLKDLAGANWFLAYFSFMSLIVIASVILAAVIMYIADLIFKASKRRKETRKVLSAIIRRLNPIKAKAEKFCVKINYKD
jgi:hypothetical protein